MMSWNLMSVFISFCFYFSFETDANSLCQLFFITMGILSYYCCHDFFTLHWSSFIQTTNLLDFLFHANVDGKSREKPLLSEDSVVFRQENHVDWNSSNCSKIWNFKFEQNKVGHWNYVPSFLIRVRSYVLQKKLSQISE